MSTQYPEPRRIQILKGEIETVVLPDLPPGTIGVIAGPCNSGRTRLLVRLAGAFLKSGGRPFFISGSGLSREQKEHYFGSGSFPVYSPEHLIDALTEEGRGDIFIDDIHLFPDPHKGGGGYHHAAFTFAERLKTLHTGLQWGRADRRAWVTTQTRRPVPNTADSTSPLVYSAPIHTLVTLSSDPRPQAAPSPA